MDDKLKKQLIGALIAVALAAAVSYGLISQQTADSIKTQTNEALTDKPSAPQQQVPRQQAPQQVPQPAPQPAPPAPAPQQPAPAEPASQNPAPRQ